uniref:Uncharacterized protein n=1 Tax=Zooxanthella nutricula TaxID=1333877 RepID=A0A6U6Q5L4_9DINO
MSGSRPDQNVLVSHLADTVSQTADGLAPALVQAPVCEGGTCELFGLFGIFVQGLIGAWCMFTLVVLWRCETPRRPFLTWLGDMSKQLVGALWGHFMNVFVAIIFGRALDSDSLNNQCVWYLVGFMSDILFVTLLCWLATAALRPVCSQRCGISIGEYDNAAQSEHGMASKSCDDAIKDLDVSRPAERASAFAVPAMWRMWILQTAIWLAIMTVVKILVSLWAYWMRHTLYNMFAMVFQWLSLCGNQNSQLVTSVIVVPVVGDAFQFIVQDGFLKRRTEAQDQPQACMPMDSYDSAHGPPGSGSSASESDESSSAEPG